MENDLLKRIDELKKIAEEQGIDLGQELRALEQRLQVGAPEPSSAKGSNAVWDRVQASRNQQRPKPQHFVYGLIKDFIELHGDRCYADDQAIMGGIGLFDSIPVTVIATRKGQELTGNLLYNFGMPHPEGYRKALRLMRQAEKFRRPVLLFVDTPGAYPGKGAESRGMSEAIAHNLWEMSTLTVPLITVITGEGGSGGALALAVSDKIHMMENATFSVITPEGCASILFKDSSLAPKAAEALKLDAESVQALGVIDDIISEGRQILTHPEEAFEAVRQVLIRDLKALIPLSPEDLLETRYRKFRDMGRLKREMSEEDFAESSPTFRIAKPF